MINLSIIIPHYNSIETLKKLLNSIPIRDDVEIIIVDDNSDIDISELNLFKRTNVKLIKKGNLKKGAGTSRNIGLENSKGKWILFADSDDFFVDKFYSHVSKYFDTDYDVVFFHSKSIEMDSGKMSDRHKYFNNLLQNYIKHENKQAELNLKYKHSVPWSKLICKNFIERNKIRFDEVLASNDVMFSTRVGYFMENFSVSREIIYCVTKNKGSLTQRTSEELYDARLNVFICYYNFLKSHLAKDEWKLLNLNANLLVLRALKNKYSILKVIKICILLKKNKVRIINRRILNPLFLIKQIKTQFISYRKDKKYLI